MNQAEANQSWSYALVRTVGYGLLVLALLDVVETFIPANFTNPDWELHMVGNLVERVPVPLIGLTLVFFGEANFRKKWEKPLLQIFSWIALVVGILYVLLIPLALSDVGRLNYINNIQTNNQVQQQMAQLDQIKARVNNASGQELVNLVNQSNNKLGLSAADTSDPQRLKNKILEGLSKTEQNVLAQAQATKQQARTALLKSASKWSLGALVSGIVFIRLWQLSVWSRGGGRRKKKVAAPPVA